MTKEQYKQIFISIFVGACVAFFTSLFDGLLMFLRDYGNDLAGGAASTVTYLARQLKSHL